MKKFLTMPALLLAVSLLAFSQMRCTKPQENRSTATPNVPAEMAPAATPDVAAIEKELMQIEHDWAHAVLRHDGDAIKRFEADDIVSTAPDGTVTSKQQDVKDVQSGNLSADAWDVVDMSVKVLDTEAAIVTGRVIVTRGKYKAPDGKIADISGQYRFTDTYARRNGQWQAVASQATKIEKLAEAAAKATPAAKASPTATPSPSPAPKASPAVKPSPGPRTTPAPSPARSTTP